MLSMKKKISLSYSPLNLPILLLVPGLHIVEAKDVISKAHSKYTKLDSPDTGS